MIIVVIVVVAFVIIHLQTAEVGLAYHLYLYLHHTTAQALVLHLYSGSPLSFPPPVSRSTALAPPRPWNFTQHP